MPENTPTTGMNMIDRLDTTGGSERASANQTRWQKANTTTALYRIAAHSIAFGMRQPSSNSIVPISRKGSATASIQKVSVPSGISTGVRFISWVP